jgi:hypothetical protein
MGADLHPRPAHDPGGSAILASVLPVRTCDAPGASECISDLFDPVPVGASWPVLNARSCKPLLARACTVIFMMSLVTAYDRFGCLGAEGDKRRTLRANDRRKR